MFKHILLATDGSTHAGKAAEAAVELAERCAARLTIVTVLPRSLSMVEMKAMPQTARLPDSVQRDIKYYSDMLAGIRGGAAQPYMGSAPAPDSVVAEIGEQILDEAEAVARKKGIANVERLALVGQPAEAIADSARKIGADMIVMGTRGLSDLQGAIVGSVSHKVLHLSDRPCFCVH